LTAVFFIVYETHLDVYLIQTILLFNELKSMTVLYLISGFHRTFFKVSHFYWPTNELICIKLKG